MRTLDSSVGSCDTAAESLCERKTCVATGTRLGVSGYRHWWRPRQFFFGAVILSGSEREFLFGDVCMFYGGGKW